MPNQTDETRQVRDPDPTDPNCLRYSCRLMDATAQQDQDTLTIQRQAEEIARLRAALSRLTDWYEHVHRERYEHSGAMNATRLSERDHGRTILATARAALGDR